MASISGSLPPGVSLRSGERLLWASKASGVTGHSQWVGFLAVFGFFFVLGPISGGMSLLTHALLDDTPLEMLAMLPALLAPFAVIALLLVAWALPRTRLSYFLTSERLIYRKLFGGHGEIALRDIRGIRRLVVVYRSRYGTREVITDRVVIELSSGRTETFGPSKEIGRVEDLIDNGVLTRWVDLDTLPAVALTDLPAPPTPAETHEGFFVCPTSRSHGDLYGPVFVGPRVIVRITEELPFHMLGRLYTTLAGAVDGEAAELALFEIVRKSTTGHFTELPRASTDLAFDGNKVALIGEVGQQLDLTLSPEAAKRLRAYAARPLPAVSGPLSLTGRLQGKPDVAPSVAKAASAAPDAPRPEGAPPPEPVTYRAQREPERPRAPDLEDPTATESGARTLSLSALSKSDTKELEQALKSDRRLLFAPTRFFAEHRALAMVAILTPIATLGALAVRFGDPCSPSQEWGWIVAYALGLAAPFALLVAYVRQLLAARSLPFEAGVYVLPRELIIARGPALRVVPLAQVAAIGSSKPLPLASHGELTFWIEGEPSESCFVPGSALEDLVPSLEAAQKAATQPPEGNARERRDPFEGLRRSDALSKAETARPRRGMGLAALVGVGAALLVGGLLFPLRNQLSDAAAFAAAMDDQEALRCYADHGGSEAERVEREIIPHAAYLAAQREGTVNALYAFIEAYPDAADAPAARIEREALAWESARRDIWSLTAFVAGYPDSEHVAEARTLMPGLALANAREHDDIDSFNSVIEGYPGTPEADEATRLRHVRYGNALEALRTRGSRRELLAFFEQLFGYLEAHPGREVRVRFRAPATTALEALDLEVRRRNRVDIEPIAPAFMARANRVRETMVYDRLRRGFAEFADPDVLPLAHGVGLPWRMSDADIRERLAAERDLGSSDDELAALDRMLHEQNDPAAEHPEIRIDYSVVPTGDVYVLETIGFGGYGGYGAPIEPRRFAGFRMDFVVELRLPDALGETPRPTMRFSVEPPESLPVDRGSSESSSRAMYDLLATAAFDQLGEQLARALYGQ